MAQVPSVHPLTDTNPLTFQECVQAEITSKFKLVNIVASFAHKIALVLENSVKEFSSVAESFKKKSNAFCKTIDGEASSQKTLLKAWEMLLQEMENDIQNQSEFASKIRSSIYCRLEELVFYKKDHIKQLFKYYDSMKSMVTKSEELLHQRSEDYNSQAVESGSGKDKAFSSCVNAHNEYVLQLAATNKLLKRYHEKSVPSAMEELKDIHVDVSNTLNNAMQKFAVLTVAKAKKQYTHYERIVMVCKLMEPHADAEDYLKSLPVNGWRGQTETKQHVFAPISRGHTHETEALLQCVLVCDKHTESTLCTKKQHSQKEVAELLLSINLATARIQSLTKQCQRHIVKQEYIKLHETQLELGKERHNIEICELRLEAARTQAALLMDDGSSQLPMTATDTNSVHAKQGGSKELWKKFAFKVRKPNESKDSLHKGTSSHNNLNGSNSEPSVSPDPVYSLLRCAATLRRPSDDSETGGGSREPRVRTTLPRQGTTSSAGGRSESSYCSSPDDGGPAAVPGTSLQKLVQQPKFWSSVEESDEQHGSCEDEEPIHLSAVQASVDVSLDEHARRAETRQNQDAQINAVQANTGDWDHTKHGRNPT